MENTKVVFLVLSDFGPLKNPQKDTSVVKAELSGDETYNPNLVPSSARAKKPYVDAEDAMKDFAKKYYIDEYEVALALAQEKSRDHPGKKYYIAQTVSVICSEVKEPEVFKLAIDG